MTKAVTSGKEVAAFAILGAENIIAESINRTHTFVINLLRNGGSVLKFKEMLGHEKLETVRIYARLAEVDP